MKKDNSKVKAVFIIKNLVYGIANDWKELKSLDAEMKNLVGEVSHIYLQKTSKEQQDEWYVEIQSIEKSLISVNKILQTVTKKINDKDPKNIAEKWGQYQKYAEDLNKRLNALRVLGQQNLTEIFQSDWEDKWSVIFDKFSKITALAEGSNVHLSMIQELAPEVLDELTTTIVKHIPNHYSMEEAVKYEKEYMEAYEEFKQEAKKRKNLWDKFLDILAGGMHQSPAERVMMKTWIEGEKGDL